MQPEEQSILSQEFSNFTLQSGGIVPSALEWLEMKRRADNVHQSVKNTQQPLWRIRDKLYDFTNFKTHPGGYDFIDMTKNTDITELFESSHYNIEKAESFLNKYFVADCAKDHIRNSSIFTFKKTGFYVDLRKRVNEYISNRKSALGYFHSSRWIHDALLFLFLSLWLVIIHPTTTSTYLVLCLEGITGLLLAMIVICAHAYFHMRDNWRMYSFDLSVLSSFEWRISHVVSHHTLPNSVMDYEILAFEPFLFFLPYTGKHHPIYRYVLPLQTCLVLLFVFPLVSIVTAIKRVISIVQQKEGVRWEYLLPVYFYLLSVALHMHWQDTGKSTVVSALLYVGKRFLWLQCTGSLFFLHISLTGAHHQPLIWHSGDTCTFRQYAEKSDGTVDWGVYQVFTIGFRPALDSSWTLSAMFFGQHVLHHLFPTLDPALLQEIHPLFLETCRDHHLTHLITGDSASKRVFSLWEGWTGFVAQTLRYEKH